MQALEGFEGGLIVAFKIGGLGPPLLSEQLIDGTLDGTAAGDDGTLDGIRLEDLLGENNDGDRNNVGLASGLEVAALDQTTGGQGLQRVERIQSARIQAALVEPIDCNVHGCFEPSSAHDQPETSACS